MTKAAELAKMGEVLTNSQIGGRRNIVINGAMQVAQRGTTSGTGGVGSANNVFPCVDRINITAGNTAGRATMTQEDISDLAGFTKAVKLDCTTADTSIAADEFFGIRYRIEAQDLQHLKKGTSDAEKFTISFFVKGNASATYTLEVKDNDNTRVNSQTFSVTTSFTRVVLTYDGDTTGALNNDNGVGFNLTFWLHAGSTYTGGTFTSNTWASQTNANRVSSSQTSFFDSTDRTFFITGLQLEVGSQATPFEHRSFGEELALCHRYCLDINPASGASPNSPYVMMCMIYNDTIAISHISFPTEMRTTPTTTLTGAAADFSLYEGNQNRVCTGFAANSLSSIGGGMNWTVNTGGMTTGNAGNVYIESNKRAFFDAEL